MCSGNHDGNEKNDADKYIAPWLQEARDQQVHVYGDNVFFGSTLITIFPCWDGDVTKMEVSEQFKQANLSLTSGYGFTMHHRTIHLPAGSVNVLSATLSLMNGSSSTSLTWLLAVTYMKARLKPMDHGQTRWGKRGHLTPLVKDSNGNAFRLASISIISNP